MSLSRQLPSEATDERTPLLVPEPESDASTVVDNEERPLPMGQVFLLCYACIIEPMAFFCIFPFINQMIYELGNVEEADVGFLSGVIESLFSLTQTIFILAWGRASDRYGRKPILVTSLAGVAVASISFGFASSVWQMMALRSFAGMFAGITVAVRTMLSENSTSKTQARAFSFFAFATNMGIFFGPLIGGALAKPAEQYPWVFGSVGFVKQFPYLLPCLITGSLAASAAVLCAFKLRETLVVDDGSKSSTDQPSMWEVLRAPGVLPVLALFQYNMLLGLAFTAVIPVFFYTTIGLGGFNFSPAQISYYLAGAGVSQALWLLVVFPPLQRRVGTGNIIRACAVAWPISLAMFPMMNALLRAGQSTIFWIMLPINVASAAGISMAATGYQLALNDVSPSPMALGTLNGIALSARSGVRAFAPAVFASLYAFGVGHQILRGYLIWVVLIVLSLGVLVALRWYPEKAEGRPESVSNHGS